MPNNLVNLEVLIAVNLYWIDSPADKILNAQLNLNSLKKHKHILLMHQFYGVFRLFLDIRSSSFEGSSDKLTLFFLKETIFLLLPFDQI
ncbi:hypothetical protein BpHYR1_013002 [Brachionus plicatilis]|uniref:Uncharacterized protein n=1 Tax=Brachionus plicatilis TaxID=10195 RepID=A0A3M7QFK7_BRAPC|nr:hypothetical protein BpHYR1_013002 [Brachionus plicatilis]